MLLGQLKFDPRLRNLWSQDTTALLFYVEFRTSVVPLLASLSFPTFPEEEQLALVGLRTQVAWSPSPRYHQNTLKPGTAAGVCGSLNAWFPFLLVPHLVSCCIPHERARTWAPR